MSSVKQISLYYYVAGGIFGNNYSRGNVKPYGSIWKVTTYTGKHYPYSEREAAPVCIYANVSGMDDPCIRKHVRENLIDHNIE